MNEMLADPTFWVGVGLALFIVILVWQKVPGAMGRVLDERANAIRAELDSAARLRADAEALLSEYLAKRAAAEKEAEGIVDAAKAEADRLAKDAQAQLEAQIERRAKMAEQKIAQAEAQALADVRAAAAHAAAQAAETVLRAQMNEAKGDAIVDAALRDVRARLH